MCVINVSTSLSPLPIDRDLLIMEMNLCSVDDASQGTIIYDK